MTFLEALYLGSHTQTTERLSVSALPSLFVDRFGRSLRFCHLELDKEAISDGSRSRKYLFYSIVILIF